MTQTLEVEERPAPVAEPVAEPRRERVEALAIGAAVFLAGGVLLGVEIAASRVLAPYFGNSLYVWGALIGVVLTGLSVGYWLGGALADRVEPARLLFAVIGLGGIGVLAVPLLDDRVLEWIVAWNPGPRLNPLIAAVVLFGPLSVVIAGVTPAAVRLRMRSLSRAGRTAGRLFSISTAGSIVGTLATAFFLIPELGIEQLFELAAATLFVAAGIVALLDRRLVALVVAVAATGAAGYLAVDQEAGAGARVTGAATQNWSPFYRLRGYGYLDAHDAQVAIEDESLTIVHAEDTAYHRLAVVEDEDTRYLRFDASLQSAMYIDDPLRTRFRYTDYFHLGLAYNPGAEDVLFVGLGAGSSPKRMLADFPDLELHAVEIDPAVVDVAYRWFELPQDPRLTVETGDGRQLLAGSERRWDVIAIDAFFADAIPFHLVTQEFLELARSRLNPGGVIVTNVIGALEGDGSRLFRSVYKTYRTVFPSVLVHPVIEEGQGGLDAFRNLIVVASESAPASRPVLADRWEEIRRETPSVPDLAAAIEDRRDQQVPTDDVPILTDDYAPTDALLFLFQ